MVVIYKKAYPELKGKHEFFTPGGTNLGSSVQSRQETLEEAQKGADTVKIIKLREEIDRIKKSNDLKKLKFEKAIAKYEKNKTILEEEIRGLEKTEIINEEGTKIFNELKTYFHFSNPREKIELKSLQYIDGKPTVVVREVLKHEDPVEFNRQIVKSIEDRAKIEDFYEHLVIVDKDNWHTILYLYLSEEYEDQEIFDFIDRLKIMKSYKLKPKQKSYSNIQMEDLNTVEFVNLLVNYIYVKCVGRRSNIESCMAKCINLGFDIKSCAQDTPYRSVINILKNEGMKSNEVLKKHLFNLRVLYELEKNIRRKARPDKNKDANAQRDKFFRKYGITVDNETSKEIKNERNKKSRLEKKLRLKIRRMYVNGVLVDNREEIEKEIKEMKKSESMKHAPGEFNIYKDSKGTGGPRKGEGVLRYTDITPSMLESKERMQKIRDRKERNTQTIKKAQDENLRFKYVRGEVVIDNSKAHDFMLCRKMYISTSGVSIKVPYDIVSNLNLRSSNRVVQYTAVSLLNAIGLDKYNTIERRVRIDATSEITVYFN
jgi:hypothetical protein